MLRFEARSGLLKVVDDLLLVLEGREVLVLGRLADDERSVDERLADDLSDGRLVEERSEGRFAALLSDGRLAEERSAGSVDGRLAAERSVVGRLVCRLPPYLSAVFRLE